MPRRSGAFTNTERKQLFFNKGCSGCLTYLIFMPLDMFVAALQGLFRGAKKVSKRRGRW